MKLVRYKPLSLWANPWQDLGRLFDLTFDNSLGLGNDVLSPSLDISEDKENIYLEADLPGFEQKDIKVKIKGDILSISAKRQETKEEKGKNFFRKERFEGSFYRTLQLPAGVDASKVNADYQKGVLKLALSKKEEEKEKEIQIDLN
ncbi:MAG: Hsp20/alpha crystallin family protein [Candidatus Omnitrophica bacterium]|nr:Hsp20/alpha crystallin family protein [Candidatus Omnitrophota bacterium]MBU2045034.1 Hsp20/alpha crystallin family protein [Candidatus Omnitrophota bacterium]MBU2251700.1 Hsp20/alpha crystallin family protein [Candidatus Omnitrophota bacterium]MBU2265954.1 Hsp20/alpha crystallin family protein [Candidatus Omnitrophota bacterium]MBU2474270.1 Hsp20/alpha crystallin family protein [Candidatus Omnitrophota bacterium]